MPYKEFADVQVGDIATDYGDHKYPVLGKGTLKEMFKQFGNRCALGLSDYLEDGTTQSTDLAVAVNTGIHWQGDVAIYMYEPDGAAVEYPEDTDEDGEDGPVK